MKESCQKIGIFGGSFSPVHTGHIGIAGEVLEKCMVDKLLFIPCRRNPLKNDDPMLSDDLRFSLLVKGVSFLSETISKKNAVEVSNIEFGMPLPSFTWDTVQKLSHSYPDAGFSLIMGADSYNDFDKWKNADKLRQICGIIVYPRPGYELKGVEENVEVLDFSPEFNVSSTEIREAISTGKDVCQWMPWADNNDIDNIKASLYGREGSKRKTD